jgi:membrane associated rhomboid family serine protease
VIPLHDDNPTEIYPVLTITIIAVCTLVYLFQLLLGPAGAQALVYSLGVIPAVLLDKASLPPELVLVSPPFTILTSMFTHGGLLHLAGNMLYLWIFGNNVEDAMGHFRFVIFYFLCGIAAAGGQIIQNPDSLIPMVGASGAISGVLGAYLLLYPHARVLVLVPLGFYATLVRIPALVVLGLWFLLQIISSAFAGPDEGGVAWYAHIAGFVAGLLLVAVFKRKRVKLFHSGRYA